jgi:hypothetical protein
LRRINHDDDPRGLFAAPKARGSGSFWNKEDRSALVTQASIGWGELAWAAEAPEAIARKAIEAIGRLNFVIDYLREAIL